MVLVAMLAAGFFVTDVAKISLATDQRSSVRKPETWNIGPLINSFGVLGRLDGRGVASRLVGLGWSRCGLAADPAALYTFSFLTLLTLPRFPSYPPGSAGWFGRQAEQGLS